MAIPEAKQLPRQEQLLENSRLQTDLISRNRSHLPINDLPAKSRLRDREQKSTPPGLPET